MKHLKLFAHSVYNEWKLPWQLVLGIVVIAAATAAIGVPIMMILGWIIMLAQGQPFEIKAAVEMGIVVLYLLLGLMIVGTYLRNKWKETSPRDVKNGNSA